MHPFLSALCTSLLLVTAVANAADNAMLAERHTKRGVACTSCHIKSPNDKPTMKQCLACHGGSYENLAKKTDESDINPHATHMGEPEAAGSIKFWQPNCPKLPPMMHTSDKAQ